tara:strand:+ start:407 stop:766 length:360 start_codon:yes stop_codon:yes gene_type:complete
MSKPRKLINVKLLGASQTHLREFIDDNKGFLFAETFAGIKQAIRRNQSVATICSINTNSATATIEKEGWENALSSSLGYYESLNEFEKCGEINLTLKLLRNEKRPARFSQTISGSVIAG